MSNPSEVACRAQASEECLDGYHVDRVYPDGIALDNTWDGFTVVCDPCFNAKGGYIEDVEAYGVKKP
jgi:hypothetical protein